MLSPKPALKVAIFCTLLASATSACLPQQSSTGGTPRRTTITGQTSGADSTSSSNTQNDAQSATTASNTTATQSASNSSCYKADSFPCKIERLIADKTNKYRASRGLQPLTFDGKISFVARDWSKKQSNSGFISHTGFPSARQNVYRTEFSESRSLNGENVAYTGMIGRTSQQDDSAAERVAEEFAVMWWNSSGHRRNMLGSFSNIGVGVAERSGGSWYATQIFN
jgi:uncharacterized protein YkwD